MPPHIRGVLVYSYKLPQADAWGYAMPPAARAHGALCPRFIVE